MSVKAGMKVLVIGLLVATLAVVGVSFGGDQGAARTLGPQLEGATGWLSSPALTARDLKGKVVVVQFWTYTCINWLRTLSHVRAWAERYKENGLVVIGVHSPEFPFEHDPGNVRRAVQAMKIDYPVATDNDFAVWRAFANAAWPAIYLIDGKGKFRYVHFGEGQYEETEKVIRQLLAEAGRPVTDDRPTAAEGTGIEAQADWADLGTPETYVRRTATRDLVSEGVAIPANLPPGRWALAGAWTVTDEAASLSEAGGRLAIQFHARDLHLVMGARSAGGHARFRVLIDGQPPGAAHGIDVDEKGNGIATDPRLYQLIRQVGPVGDRRFEIEFLDPGVQVFVFTFG